MNIKRFASRSIAVLALGSGVLLASCSSVDSVDAVATVNGVKISQDDFDHLSSLLTDASIFTLTDGELATEDARSILRTMISAEITKQVLADNNIEVTDDDRDAFREQVKDSAEFTAYSTELQDVIIDLYAHQGALSRVKQPSDSELKDLYESAPGATGLLCIRHLVVEDEATAKEALAEYNDGTDFAELAGKYSTEPNATETGGALTNQGEPCLAVSQYQGQFDLDFVRGALSVIPGKVIGPVKSSFGWHLIYSRPYDDVKESIANLYSQSSGAALVDAESLVAKIRVDSSFGKWDSKSGSVIDL